MARLADTGSTGDDDVWLSSRHVVGRGRILQNQSLQGVAYHLEYLVLTYLKVRVDVSPYGR